MIGLDTNVLVRYVTQDDPVQSPKGLRVDRIFHRVFTGICQPGVGCRVGLGVTELLPVCQK